MRYVLVACVLVACATSAQAKEWEQMNGHERRASVIAYISKNNLSCKKPSGSVAEQEAQLMQYNWQMVAVGLTVFCKKAEVAAAAPPYKMQRVTRIARRALTAHAEVTPRKVFTPSEEVRRRWPKSLRF